MPIASMSAYLKRDFPWVEIILKPILILRDSEKYSPENYARSIQELDADLIAFSLMSPHWHPIVPYLEVLKTEIPQLPILIGGYQAMLSQQQTIENPNVDYICVGDGEYAIANIAQHLTGKKDGPADGMWEKLNDGSVYETDAHQIGELASLPFPDYDIFAINGSFTEVNTSIFGPKGKLVLPVMTGRGCPYKCTYCCNTPILEGWKTKKTFLRKYDPEDMVNELIRLRDDYNIEYFEFWDELFLSNLKFVKAFFELYKEKIRLTFNIVGMPLETAENMRQTLKLNQAIAPEFFFFFPYVPLRGTPLYNFAKEKGLLFPGKRPVHFLSAVNDREFIMNMKERPELMTAQEYTDICMQMMAFQEVNNRLSYTEGNQQPI